MDSFARPGVAGRPDSGRGAQPRGGSDQQGQHGRGDGDQAERLFPRGRAARVVHLSSQANRPRLHVAHAQRESILDGVLDGGKVLPGFRLPLKTLFTRRAPHSAATALPQKSENPWPDCLLSCSSSTTPFLAARKKPWPIASRRSSRPIAARSRSAVSTSIAANACPLRRRRSAIQARPGARASVVMLEVYEPAGWKSSR